MLFPAKQRVSRDFDGEEFPPKPKGMHWKTYWRLEERYDDLKFAWTVGMMQQFGFGLGRERR